MPYLAPVEDGIHRYKCDACGKIIESAHHPRLITQDMRKPLITWCGYDVSARGCQVDQWHEDNPGSGS